jgi:hypothetical protein
MRTTLVALAALAISTPLAAQANGMAGMNMDPTKAIHGTGVLPSQFNGLSIDGQAGIRVNHNSDLHVDWKGVTK